MNYRFCEKCIFSYSTGKDYEDHIGQRGSLAILKGIDESKLETKGLCPFCNPNSIYYQRAMLMKKYYNGEGIFDEKGNFIEHERHS